MQQGKLTKLKPKKKKRYRLSRIFNNIPHMAVNFVLARPPNQNWIIDKYAEDTSIDLECPEVKKEITEELTSDLIAPIIFLPGINEFFSNSNISNRIKGLTAGCVVVPIFLMRLFSSMLGVPVAIAVILTSGGALAPLALGGALLVNSMHFFMQVENSMNLQKKMDNTINKIERRRHKFQQKLNKRTKQNMLEF